MIMRITWGKLHSGKWSEFEQAYRTHVVAKGANVKGLQGRWLAQDTADADAGYAVSLWDTLADMRAYEQSALYKQIVAPLQPFFVGEFTTHTCDVKHAQDA